MTPIRVLYVGFDVAYINRTRQLMVKALARASEVMCFGPGFLSPDMLAEGVHAFYRKNGPFFAVVSDEYVLQEMDPDRQEATRFVNHACRFDRGCLIKALEYRRFLKTVDCRRILMLSQIDYYNLEPRFLEQLAALSDYVVGWGPELITRRGTMTNEAGLITGLTPVDRQIVDRWSDRYREFLLAHSERIISLPHVVAETELSSQPLRKRRKPWAVLGADYTQRVLARRQLDAAGLARSGKTLPYVFAGFQRSRINPYAHYWSIAFLRRHHRASLTQARYGYTCGSIAKMAIRKYFEIPAAGCALAADPCQGFEELGFRDGVNAIMASGTEVAEVHNWLSGLSDNGQAIADAGRALIQAQHTIKARARQLAAAFTAIAEGRFAGSRWTNGRFRLRAPDGTETAV